MVCSIESGRMAVMARLLAAGSLSQSVAEEAVQEKLVAQYLRRELREADEANLLDEEDMHVFGLRPMTDPLHLVSCNLCRKPVTTSQYAAHSELCKSLKSAEEKPQGQDGSIARRKPMRKEKKRILSTYITTPFGEQERSESTVTDDGAATESQFKGQPRRISACVDVAFKMDGKGVSSENTDYSACVMPPPTKRSKLISSWNLSQPVDLEPASGLTKIASTQDPFACQGFQIQSAQGSGMPNNCGIVSEYPRETNGCCLMIDIPVPLATKIYYSQRNNRFRSAIAHHYNVTSSEGLRSNMESPEVSKEILMQLQASSQRGFSHEQADDQLNEKREASAHNQKEILGQSSEVCLDKPGECLPAMNFNNKFLVNNMLTSQTASAGMLRSKYISKPYSFQGKSLGSIRQPNGSVSVL